ncbi:MAG: hypothetical protein KDA37_12665, partial [Planctomycetales bacterium]|nr:hypothetical protein [Planctomycetales bacterium]
GDEFFEFSLRPYSTRDLSRARHPYELPERDFYELNLNHRQMGVGGDDSWGAHTHREYTPAAGEYAYSFTISPRRRVDGE